MPAACAVKTVTPSVTAGSENPRQDAPLAGGRAARDASIGVRMWGAWASLGPDPPSRALPARRAGLALQLPLGAISGLLRRHGSEVTGGGRRDRGCVGVVGLLAAGGEAAHPAAVHAGAGGPLGGAVPGRAARAERRKTGWTRAEAAGDPGPWVQQAILGRGRWEADALRDLVRDYAIESLADSGCRAGPGRDRLPQAGPVASGGVARQYTGSAGNITNCQIGVFAAYVSRHGHAFIDREQYAQLYEARHST